MDKTCLRSYYLIISVFLKHSGSDCIFDKILDYNNFPKFMKT